MRKVAIRSTLTCVVLALAAGLACTPTETPGVFEPLVFPSEARLGGTAAVVIDSNYIALADDYERYDLENDRVHIILEDATGARADASLRQVFDLEPAAWSRYAQTRPGAWATVALFDLPQTGLATGPATVIVEIEGVEDATRQGRIEIVGSGGAPTEIVFPSAAEDAETLLESEPILRLRAIRADAGNPGFQDAWTIAGIELDVEYYGCLRNARAFPDSDAARATAVLGPPQPGAPLHERRHVVLVDPKGFRLARPNDYFGLASPTSAGQGPFLTMAFDRGTAITCSGELGPGYFKIENLYVTDVDGQSLIDRRGQGDSTDLVDVVVVDTEASS